MLKNRNRKKKAKNSSKSKLNTTKSPSNKNDQQMHLKSIDMSKAEFYSTPTNTKFLKLTDSSAEKQHFSSASSSVSHNESFLSAKSSLKTTTGSTNSSSLVNNFNKHVKFLIDYTTTPSTRSTSNERCSKLSSPQQLLLPSPVTTHENSSSSGNCSNFNETPLQYSRTSSLESLNSYSYKSPIASSVPSEYSISRQGSCFQSGLHSPVNEQVSFLTNDSNPKSNEITVIERTILQNTVLTITSSRSNEKNENTVLYECENSPWECHTPNSDISSLSLIREDNQLKTPINADLDAIYKLLNNKKRQEKIMFTPPVKLTNEEHPRVLCQAVDDPLSPTCSELSIPSVLREDMKTCNLSSIDMNLLSSKLKLSKTDSSDELSAVKPCNAPAVKYHNSSNGETRKESSNDDEEEQDDNKILLDFVNTMLPTITKKENAAPADRVKSSREPVKRSTVPVVNMTRTAQLRVIKMQKLKSEMNKAEASKHFKAPAVPPSKSKTCKNVLKRI